MTFGQIAILAVIVGVFFTLGVVLGWASWYSQSRTHRRVRHHRGAYSTGSGLIADDH